MMTQSMFRVTVTVKVVKVTAKMLPQGPAEAVDFGMSGEAMGEGRTEKEAYDNAYAAGMTGFVEKLGQVLPATVVTPFPQA